MYPPQRLAIVLHNGATSSGCREQKGLQGMQEVCYCGHVGGLVLVVTSLIGGMAPGMGPTM
jgi:hypothetical protein